MQANRLDPWEVRDPSKLEDYATETRGIREKKWVVDTEDHSIWLHKEARRSREGQEGVPAFARPYEIPVEAFTLRLARFVGLRAPRSRVCESANATSGERVRALLVERFGDEKDVLSSGQEVLNREFSDYDSTDYSQHSLSRVRVALEKLEQEYPRSGLLFDFTQLLVFDSWIGNTDRHQGNWSILRAADSIQLAPVYDTAACLGSELHDTDKRLLDASNWDVTLGRYIQGCRSGFGDEDGVNGGGRHKGMLHEAHISLASQWPEWQAAAPALVAKFEQAMESAVGIYLDNAPDDWWPKARRELAYELLRRRLGWLKGRQ